MTKRRAGTSDVAILTDTEELARRAAAEVVTVLGGALERGAVARWVLAGGSTPRRLYEILAGLPQALDWQRVELFWGDERCVGPSSSASNFAMVRDTLLAHLPFDSARVHRVRGELPPAEGARRYGRHVEAVLAAGPFDLVLLGLGADGHVASLFPGALPAVGEPVAVVEAPTEPKWRVTMVAATLARTRRLIYVVQGGDKAPAVAAALATNRQVELVSDLVRPETGGTLWLLDREAAAQLPGSHSGPVVA